MGFLNGLGLQTAPSPAALEGRLCSEEGHLWGLGSAVWGHPYVPELCALGAAPPAPVCNVPDLQLKVLKGEVF